jgi:hypothetical protein
VLADLLLHHAGKARVVLRSAQVTVEHHGNGADEEPARGRERPFPGAKRSSSVVIAKRKMSSEPDPGRWRREMRFAIQAVISEVDGRETRTEDIGVLEYNADAAPASGLGLFIGEAHRLLRQLQTVVLREQAARFMERASRCRQCGSRLGVKDTKTIVYRTVYGKAC